nr:antibiotic biosynthesis monooxygenase [uncultured Pseudogulbenkiania sp.]
MNQEVYWLLELAIQPGQREAFDHLMTEMVEATGANEPDALNYEWNVSSDGSTCHIYERYRDSAAALTHLDNFGTHFAERFLALLTPTRLSLYGHPSAELQAALANIKPSYLSPVGGFRR